MTRIAEVVVGADPDRWARSPFRAIDEMGAAELDVVRLVLRGGSVVDWRRLWFRDAADVDAFLRLNLFDPRDARDERRLRAILAQAVDYLRNAVGYRVAAAVADPEDVRDLFLFASGTKEPQRYRRIACVVLKCMHAVHHLEARELLFRTPLRESDLAERVDRRVMAEARSMRALGFPIVEFHGNVKSRASLISKLIAKRETVAAQIFDRVRYRIVTEREEDVAPLVWHLTETLFPFNLAVPGQSENSLVTFRELLEGHPLGKEVAAELHAPIDVESRDLRKGNEFSGKDYRVVNFVVDLPVRIDELLPADGTFAEDLGRVVFSAVEFQILDSATARRNEEGDSSHQRYKQRQRRRVLRRLSRGLVVPKRRPRKRGKE
jgi:uncharacterized protein (TIGR04552 family)